MMYPTLCADNFFDEPDKVVELTHQLKYHSDAKGTWPGLRSDVVHNINQPKFNGKVFCNGVCKKIIATLYPMNYRQTSWRVSQYFQKISSDYSNPGWIHNDPPVELTAIIFLSHHKRCGTSLYHPRFLDKDFINSKIKETDYKNELIEKKAVKKALQENNDNWEETISINSRYNRLILFDSYSAHAAQQFLEPGIKEDRLTLITFFNEITAPGIKFPLTEMHRI